MLLEPSRGLIRALEFDMILSTSSWEEELRSQAILTKMEYLLRSILEMIIVEPFGLNSGNPTLRGLSCRMRGNPSKQLSSSLIESLAFSSLQYVSPQTIYVFLLDVRVESCNPISI